MSLRPRALCFRGQHESRPTPGAPPLPLAGEGRGGGSISIGTRRESPHPPRVARHPPPQAGEGSIVARMERSAIRDKSSRLRNGPGFRFALSGLHLLAGEGRGGGSLRESDSPREPPPASRCSAPSPASGRGKNERDHGKRHLTPDDWSCRPRRCRCRCASANNPARRRDTSGSRRLPAAACACRGRWPGCDPRSRG
jgi:hypothetical protein